MFDNLVIIIDLFSLIACLTILVIIIINRKVLDRSTFIFILFAISIAFLVFVSNCLENFLKIDLDNYEDYAEILFLPLLVFSIYSFSLNHELKYRRSAELALKEKSARLSYALEGANEGMWDWEINANSLYFSAEVYTLLGYKPFSYIPAINNWTKLINPSQIELEKNFRDSFFQGDNESKSIELQLLTSDGIYKWVFVKGKTVEKNEDGSPARISGIVLDISQMKKIEEDLIISKQKAEESEILKSAFLANMSHELRTPLNGILGFANLMQDEGNTPEKQNEYISYINQNSNILLNLINDIIDISRIESGQLRLSFETFSLNKLLENIYVFYKSTQSEKLQNLKFSFFLGLEDIESNIICDENRLRQILVNLIDNALKNTEKGFIRFGYRVEKKNELLFFVEDSGLGIDKKDHKIIFERFRQADGGLNLRKGSGLGLAICKGIISKLNGDIWVESEPGNGATFYFKIPLRKEHYKAAASFIRPDKIDWSKHKILIVEDDAVSMQFFTEVLESSEIKIVKAINGNDALQKFISINNIAMILLDIQLPDIDGYQVIEKIRQINPYIPVIAETAYAGEKEEEKALKHGFTNYIVKPISPSKLINMISLYLDKK